jgi:hypothetical protein
VRRLSSSWLPQMGPMASTGPNEGWLPSCRINLQGKRNSRAGSCQRTVCVPGSLRTDDAVAASHLRLVTSRNENWLGSGRRSSVFRERHGKQIPVATGVFRCICLPLSQGRHGFRLRKHDWICGVLKSVALRCATLAIHLGRHTRNAIFVDRQSEKAPFLIRCIFQHSP